MLEIGYIALTLLMTLILINIISYTINKSYEDAKDRSKYKKRMVIGLLFFLVYEIALGSSGFLENLSFPPRFALCLIVPCFIFTGLFLNKNKNKAWVKNIPSQRLLYFQSFRILVETLFVYSVAANILPKEVTIEGYNMDMVLGISAPIIGWVFVKYKTRKLAILWNYLGLAILASVIFVFMTSLFKPELYGSSIPLLTSKATEIPYLFVAGYLMPMAVFVHVLSILNLKKTA